MTGSAPRKNPLLGAHARAVPPSPAPPSSFSEWESILSGLVDRMAALRGDLAGLGEAVAEGAAESAGHADALARLEERGAAAAAAADRMAVDVRSIGAALVEAAHRLSGLEAMGDRMDGLASGVGALYDRIVELGTEQRLLVENQGGTRERVATIEAARDGMDARIAALAGEVRDLGGLLSATEGALAARGGELSRAALAVAALEQTSGAHSEELSRARESLAATARDLASVVRAVENLSENLGDLSRAADARWAASTSRLEGADAAIAELRSDGVARATLVDSSIAAIGTHLARLERALDSGAAAVGSRVDRVEDSVRAGQVAADERAEKLRDLLDGTRIALGALEHRVVEGVTRIDAFEESLRGAQVSVDRRADGLAESIAGARADLAALERTTEAGLGAAGVRADRTDAAWTARAESIEAAWSARVGQISTTLEAVRSAAEGGVARLDVAVSELDVAVGEQRSQIGSMGSAAELRAVEADARMTRIEGTVASFDGRFAGEHAEVAAWRSEISALLESTRADFASMREDYRATTGALVADGNNMRAEIAELRRTIAEESAASLVARNDGLQDRERLLGQIALLRAALEQAEAERRDLRAELAGVVSTSTEHRVEMAAGIASARSGVDGLVRTTAAQVEGVLATASRLDGGVAAVRRDLEDLRTEYARDRARGEEAVARAAAAAESAIADLAAVRGEMIDSGGVITMIAEVRSDVAAVAAGVEAAGAGLVPLQGRLDDAEGRVTGLDGGLREMGGRVDALHKRLMATIDSLPRMPVINQDGDLIYLRGDGSQAVLGRVRGRDGAGFNGAEIRNGVLFLQADDGRLVQVGPVIPSGDAAGGGLDVVLRSIVVNMAKNKNLNCARISSLTGIDLKIVEGIVANAAKA